MNVCCQTVFLVGLFIGTGIVLINEKMEPWKPQQIGVQEFQNSLIEIKKLNNDDRRQKAVIAISLFPVSFCIYAKPR